MFKLFDLVGTFERVDKRGWISFGIVNFIYAFTVFASLCYMIHVKGTKWFWAWYHAGWLWTLLKFYFVFPTLPLLFVLWFYGFVKYLDEPEPEDEDNE